jgi:hypothetical protein
MDEDEAVDVLILASDEDDPTLPYPYADVEADQPFWQNLGER